ATVEVRSAFAGTLRADPDNPWPVPGRRVRSGQVLGRVDVRVGPQEKLDLQAKLSEARFKQEGAEKVLKVQQERVARFKSAGPSEIVSQKDLDDAEVALAEAQTQLATAKAAVELWHKALAVIEQQQDHPTSTWSEPLRAPADGEVTELAGKPGMAVEPGGLVVRVVDFRRPWVRLDIPSEALAEGPPTEVELVAVGAISSLEEAGSAISSIRATLVGPTPQVEVTSQFSGYWYEAQRSEAAPKGGSRSRLWRPGLFVTA